MSLQSKLEEEFFKKNNRADYLDTWELAARWNTSRNYLANRRNKGKGPECVLIGSRVFYPIEAVKKMENVSEEGT